MVRTFRRTCTFCLGPGTASHGPDGRPWDYDHYVPKARGGSCRAANLVLACETCNYQKDCELWLPGTTSEAFGAPTLLDFLAWLDRAG
ncbi:MAG: HNH endonuclease [Actinobacteria bacterium]|nr:HNH endonuclease [Actinomycetota bacterium]